MILSGQELGKVKEWLLDKSGRFVIAFVADGEDGCPRAGCSPSVRLPDLDVMP